MIIITVCSSDDSIVVSWVFLCPHDNSWNAALSSTKFCMIIYLDYRTNPTEYQGQGHWTGSPLRDRAKKFVNKITHEPLQLAWWNIAWTCTSTTSRTSYQGHTQRSRSYGFFCMFLCATAVPAGTAEARISYGNSVCLSVRHGPVQKQPSDIETPGLHRMIA